MKSFKVNLHSAVDVITNSSTTIFTYSGGSHKKAIELINGILSAVGSELKAEDMFYMGVFIEDMNYYFERVGDDYWGEDGVDVERMKEDELEDSLIEALSDEDLDTNEFINKILRGEIKKPKWLDEAEDMDDGDGYNYGTTLYVLPKKEEYADVAKMITDFLYSTDHEASYC